MKNLYARYETHAEAAAAWNRLYREFGIISSLTDTYSDVNYAGSPRIAGTKPFAITIANLDEAGKFGRHLNLKRIVDDARAAGI